MGLLDHETLRNGVDRDEIRDELDRLSHVERVRTAMQLASYFLEYAAYEMALDEAAHDVSEIILMSAKLDQTAQRIDADALRASERSQRKM